MNWPKWKTNSKKIMRKLAIFDFDGTLFDSLDDVVVNFNKTLEIHNFPTLTRKEYIERVGGNIDEMTAKILDDNATPENIELVKDTYEKLYDASNYPNTKPFDGMHDVLMKLQENNTLIAINSNRKTDSIRYYIEKYLNDINFIRIEGHNPEYPSKPSPVGVEKIIENANVGLDETVYIGDSRTDIKTAENAGIDCILVKWGYGNQADYDDEYVLEAVDDASKLITFFKL